MKKFFLLLGITYSCLSTNAKTIITSSNSDINLHPFNNSYGCVNAHVNTASASTLNCDMYEPPGVTGKFWVVAYTVVDDGIVTPPGCLLYTNVPQALTGIKAEYTGALPLAWNNTDFALVNASEPDIVIGDNLAKQIGHNIIGVVYNNTNGTDVEICTLDADDVGNGALPGPVISSPSSGIVLNTSGLTARNPHIDLFGDDKNQIGGSNGPHALNKFIVTWTEHNSSGPADYIMAAIGDLNNPGSYVGPYTISTDGISPDVGAMGISDPLCCGTSTDYAYITYIESSTGDLKLAELDITGTTINSVSISTLSVAGVNHSIIEAPRIESRSYANPTDGKTNWEVAVSLIPYGGADYEIHTFNNVTSTAPVLTCSSSGDQHWSPAVTGVGEDQWAITSGNVGERSFTVAYYSTYSGINTNGDIFANEIDMSTGTLPASDYYQVNNTPLYQPYSSSFEIPVAATSTSNTGDDLFVTWYQGYLSSASWGDIHYQYGGNTYTFKPGRPTDIENSSDLITFKIHPNPTTNSLHVSGIYHGKYRVIDAMGREVLKGNITKKENTINTNALIPGIYKLLVLEDNIQQSASFIKQD